MENNIKIQPKLNPLLFQNLRENGCPHAVRGFYKIVQTYQEFMI